MNQSPKVAFNPLTWLISATGEFDPGNAPPLPTIYREIRDAGFTAVHSEIPDGMAIGDYRQLLDDTGLTPAPGYFQAPFHEPAATASTLEEAKRAAAQHAALGLTHIFIASTLTPQRSAVPAQGAAYDDGRLATIVDNLGAAAAVMVAEGVTPCLHQHVGSWIETEHETTAVLDGIEPGLLLFGPDTGHLTWAGADPVALIVDRRERVGAVHLKDVRQSVAKGVLADGADYRQAVARHLWTEPGRGDVDFEALLAALTGFDGWYVIEVDLADQPTPKDTAAVSARWVADHWGALASDQA
jgi:inosose dehydratase